MADTPTLAVSLLQAGVLLGVVLLARIVVGRHVPVETIPDVLGRRVALWNRLCPWLLVATLTMAGVGLVLHLLG